MQQYPQHEPSLILAAFSPNKQDVQRVPLQHMAGELHKSNRDSINIKPRFG